MRDKVTVFTVIDMSSGDDKCVDSHWVKDRETYKCLSAKEIPKPYFYNPETTQQPKDTE